MRQTPLVGIDQHDKTTQLFIRRAARIFDSGFAKRPDALALGTQIKVRITEGWPGAQMSFGDLPDEETIAHVVVLLRPFTLAKDTLAHSKVRAALRSFPGAADPRIAAHLDNLDKDWRGYPAARWQIMAGNQVTGEMTLKPIWDSEIARKWLYSDLVHADDEADILDALGDPEIRQAGCAMARDGLILVANTWWLAHQLRPDLAPEPPDLDGKLRFASR